MTSVYAPTIAAGAKAIAFGDYSYYWVADRQGRSLKRLNELFAMNGQVGFLDDHGGKFRKHGFHGIFRGAGEKRGEHGAFR